MTALLDHLWQSTLFALPLGALTLLLHRHAASVRFWLWFAASVKFLVPFSMLMAMGAAITLPAAPMLPDGPTLQVLQGTAALMAVSTENGTRNLTDAANHNQKRTAAA